MCITIRWWGHACFEITYKGVSLAIDPHDGASIGLKRPGAQSDYVIMSHDHFDHNAYRVVLKREGRHLMMALGVNDLGPFRVKGIETFHDKERGRRRGRNVAYLVEVPEEGIRVFHAGDLGHTLSPEQAREAGSPHIAMLPVGGTFTIDYEEALEVFRAIGARVLIPMHYWVKGVNLPLYPVDKFVERALSSMPVYMVRGSEVDACLSGDMLTISSRSPCRETGRGEERVGGCRVEVRGGERVSVVLEIG